MIDKLNSIFKTSSTCKEDGHPCKISSQGINKVYKPDLGVQDSSLKQELFPNNNQPKLCDCAIVYGEKIALVEIKCGKVTSHLIKDVVKKLANTYIILNKKDIPITKCILLYQRFDNTKTRQLLKQKKNFIFNNPIIEKIYNNNAISI